MPSKAAAAAAAAPTGSNAATDPAAIDDATWSATATGAVQRSSEIANEVASSATAPDGTTACGIIPSAATISAANAQGTSPQTVIHAEAGRAPVIQPVGGPSAEQQTSATAATLGPSGTPGAVVLDTARGIPQPVAAAKAEHQHLAANASSHHVATPDSVPSGGPQLVAGAEADLPPTAALAAPASAVSPTIGDETWLTSLHVDAIALPVASSVPKTLNSLDKGLQHHLRYCSLIVNHCYACLVSHDGRPGNFPLGL